MKNLISGLLGMGVGVLAGICIYRYATSDQGRKMRKEIAHVMRDSSQYFDSIAEAARNKAAQVNAKMDEKVRNVADKIETM